VLEGTPLEITPMRIMDSQPWLSVPLPVGPRRSRCVGVGVGKDTADELTSSAMASVGESVCPERRSYVASLEDTNAIRFACGLRLISLR
jgi:hypothetical protein